MPRAGHLGRKRAACNAGYRAAAPGAASVDFGGEWPQLRWTIRPPGHKRAPLCAERACAPTPENGAMRETPAKNESHDRWPKSRPRFRISSSTRCAGRRRRSRSIAIRLSRDRGATSAEWLRSAPCAVWHGCCQVHQELAIRLASNGAQDLCLSTCYFTDDTTRPMNVTYR